MIRLTFGKHEIYPSNELLKWNWKDNDQVAIKMRLLGGGTESNWALQQE